MGSVWQRIQRAGFFIFLFSMVVVAIGVSQGMKVLWVAGLVVVGLVLLTVLFRANRAVSGPPRRPPTTDATKRQ